MTIRSNFFDFARFVSSFPGSPESISVSCSYAGLGENVGSFIEDLCRLPGNLVFQLFNKLPVDFRHIPQPFITADRSNFCSALLGEIERVFGGVIGI